MKPIATYSLSGRLFAARAAMIFCFLSFISLNAFSQIKPNDVKKAPPFTTTLTIMPATGIVGGSVTLSATLYVIAESGGLPNVNVAFYLGSPAVNVGSAVTDASGVATLTISLTANGTSAGTLLNVGTYGIAADYGGAANFAPSSGSSTLTVNPEGVTTTALALSNSAGPVGGSATLTATLTQTGTNSPIVGEPVTFNFASVTVTVNTVANGIATLNVPLTTNGMTGGTLLSAGAYSLSASFAGTSSLGASVSSTEILVVGPAISLTGTPAVLSTTAGTPSSSTSFSLSGSNLTPGNLTVTAPAGFDISADNGATWTGSGGNYVIAENGTLSSTAVFVRLDGGDTANDYSGNVTISGGGVASLDTSAFGGDASLNPGIVNVAMPPGTVDAITTALALTNNTGPFGGSVILTATLTQAGNSPVSGESVTFNLGSPAVQVGSAVTNANGIAALTISLTADGTSGGTPLSGGNYPITASFAGDGTYAGITSPTATLTVIPPPPVLSTTGTPSALNTTSGTASPSTSFDISGMNLLPGNLTVTAPSGFDVSHDNSTWSGSGGNYTIAETGTLSSMPVYIRLDAVDAVNSYSGNVSISGGGISTVTVSIPSGTVAVQPVILTSGAPSPVSTTVGTASSSTSFTVLGTHMVAGILVTPGTGFEVSTDNSTFSSSVTVGAAGSISTKVFIRLKASDGPGSYSGSIVLSSQGATTVNVGMPASTVSSPTAISSITANSPYSNASAVTFTVRFAASVTGLNTSNFSLTTSGVSGASIFSLSGSGLIYSVTVNTGSGEGTIRLNLANATDISPDITTTLPFAGGTTTIDRTPPTISIGAPSVSIANQNATVTYTITYADANFDTSDISINTSDITLNQTGGTAADIDIGVSGHTATVYLSNITGNGTLGISVGAGTASDLAGNEAPAAGPSAPFAVNNTPPVVSSITATSPSNTNPTNATSVTYTVTFSEAIMGLNSTDFDATTSGATTTSDIVVTPVSGTVYSVTVNGISGTGTLRLDFDASHGDVTDAAGNVATSGFTSGDTYTIDQTPPTITIGPPSVSSIADGAGTVTYSVTYADANFNTSTLVPLNVTLNKTGNANGTIGVTENTPTSYTVTVSGITGAGTLGISIAPGTATDLAGNSAPAVSQSTTFNVIQSAIIIVPGITITVPGATAGTAGTSASFLVSGNNLTPGNLTVTAPASFDVSPNNSNWTSSYTIAETGTLGPTILYVRLSASDVAGNPGGNVTISGGGASSQTLSVNGTVTNPAALTVTGGTINVPGTTAGTAGQSTTFSISGSNLTAGNLTVAAPPFFDVSPDNSTWNSSYTIAETGTVASVTVYVRLSAPDVAGTPGGNVTISGGGASQTQAVSGSVTNPPALTVTGGTINVPGTTAGTAGASTTFSISGSNLTAGNLTVAAPTDFEVSSDNVSFSSSYIIAETGTLAATLVYVRIGPGVGVGSPIGIVNIFGGGATLVSQSISGTITSPTTTVTSLSSVTGTPTNATTLTFTAMFAAPVSGLLTTDFALNSSGITGASILSVSGSGTSWTITVNTGTGDGTVQLLLNGSPDITPSVSNLPFSGDTYTIDKTPPTITIGSPSVSSIADGAGSVTYTVTYADPNSNFNTSTLALGDITLNAIGGAGGTLALAENSSTSYTVTVSGITDAGTLGISIAAGTASDLAGNLAQASGASATFNVVKPAISLSGAPSSLSTTTGTASSPTSFNVSGTNLIAGNLTVTGVPGFDLSSDNATWSASGANLTIAETGTLSSTPVYVRLDAGDVPNSYSGDVSISGGGATTVTVPIPSSTVSAPAGPVLTASSGTDSYLKGGSAIPVDNGITVTAGEADLSTSAISITDNFSPGDVLTCTDPNGLSTGYNPGTGVLIVKFTGSVADYQTAFQSITFSTTSSTPGIRTISFFVSDQSGTISNTVTKDIIVSLPPALATSGSPSALSTTSGTASSSTNFNISGTNLTAGNLTVTAPAGFDVSPDNSTWTAAGGSYTIAETGTVSAAVYVRLDATDAPNNYADHVTIRGGGATTINQAVSGTVISPSTTISMLKAVTSLNTNASSVQYTATFAVGVSGLTSADFSLNTSIGDASISNVTGSGTTWTIMVNTGSGDGSIQLVMNSTSGVSPSVSNLPFSGDTYVIDKTAPTVTLSSPSVSVVNSSATVSFTATYSDANLNTSSISLNPAKFFYGGSGYSLNVGNVSITGSGATRTISFTGITGNGTFNFSLPSGTASDNAGNPAGGSNTTNNVTVDNTAPTITSIIAATPSNTSPTNATGVTYTVTFSEAVTGLNSGDFIATTSGVAITGIVVTPVSSSVCTVAVNGISGTGTLRLDFNALPGDVTDAAGNVVNAGFNGGDTYTIDHTMPTVVSLSRTDPTPGNETSLDWQITFSEPVSNVNPADFFTTATGGLSAGAVSISKLSPSVYNISVASVNGDGTLQMSLYNGTPITDLAGNLISGGFSGDTYTVNQTLPVVNSITALGSNPNNANSDQFSVTFSEAVFGVDATDFTLTNTGNVSGTIASVVGSGTTYTVTVNNVTGDGTMRLDLNTSGDPINDAATNILASAFTTGAVYTIDHTAPTVSSITAVTPTSATPTNTTSAIYLVTFSEPVTGVDYNDFTLTTSGSVSGIIANVSGNATTYTVTLSNISGSGTLRLDLKSGSGITDLAGNAVGGFTNGDTYFIDQTAPTVSSITAASPSNTNPTNATSVTYTVTFSELVTGVNNGAFTVTASGTSGTVTNVSGSGATYSVTVSGISGNGTLRLDLSSGSGITDVAGNAVSGGFTGGDTYTIDNIPPTVVSLSRTDPTPSNETSLDWQITFSEPVSNVNPADFFTTATGGLSAGAISISKLSPSVYNISVASVSGNGTLQMSLSNGTPITDLAGNLISGGFSGDTYTVNQTLPVVTAITALGSSPNNANSDQFSVTFSEAVFGVDATDFTLTNTGNVSGTIASVSGSGTTYTVTVNNVTGDGTMRLDLNTSGDPINDATQNILASGFTTGAVYTIDHTAPTVVSLSRTDPNPSNATELDWQITFSEPVSNVNTADFFTTATGGLSAGAISISKLSSSVYNITVANVSGNGTLQVNLSGGGPIADLAGNIISGGFNGDTYTVQQTLPSVSSITATTPTNTNPTNAASVTYTVTFSEPVTGVNTADFTVTTSGSTIGTVSNVSGGPTAYTVTVNGISGSGTLRLDLKSGTGIQDAAGNAISGGFTGGDTYTIDNTAPTVTIGNPSQSTTSTGPVSYTVTYADANFNTSTLATGNITLNKTGTANGTVGVSGSGASYTVTISGITGSGSLGISIAAGTASDRAGNLAPASAPSATFAISSADATLSSLSTSTGTLSPSFTSGQMTYTESVPATTTSITVKPTANTTTAKSITVTAGGVTNTVASGVSSPAIALAIGPNIITVKITAQDGVTTDTYTITVTRVGSSNANLASLLINTCSLSPSFSTNVTSYTASVVNAMTTVTLLPIASDATATIKVNGVTVLTGHISGAIPLNVGQNTITVAVTAQDGTLKMYTIIVTRAPSTNAYLAELAISSGTLTPSFSTYTTAYAASVSNTTTSITVTPTTSDPTATIKVNGTIVASGTASGNIALAVGKTIINTVVTAQDGKTVITYSITVTRAASANANLANLIISSGPLSPLFAVGTANYTATVASTTASVTVTATAGDPTASIKVNGTTVASGAASGSIALAVGKTVINTVVTAQDGKTVITYSIMVTRAGSTNANLANLVISGGPLTPVFATNVTSYAASVANTTTSTTVTPTTSDPTATVKVNGTTVKSGSASGSITLAVGKNTITTVVTAGDGKTTLTYTVTVTRAASTNASLAGLKFSCGSLTPAFAAGTTGYTISVSNSVKSTTVTPTTSDATATVKVNGTTVKSGYASGSITLAVGKNTITTVVTAQDGITTKTYTVTVTRATGSVDSFVPEISVTEPTETPALADDGIRVHQAVSPNGDGINDFLTIENISQYPDNKLMVMNRNGQLIYEVTGYNNSSKAFDGHSNKTGQMQLPGTYFYQLDYTVKGIAKHKTGFIILKY